MSEANAMQVLSCVYAIPPFSEVLTYLPFCKLNFAKLHHFGIFKQKICAYRNKFVPLPPKLHIIPILDNSLLILLFN